MNDLQQKKKMSYTPVIIGLCFLMVFTCLGFCSSPKKLFLEKVPDVLGVDRSVYSLSDSFRYISTSIINIFFGALLNHFGPRKLIAAGFTALAASSLLYAVATNVATLYVGGCLLGIGLSWTTTTMVGAVVNRWCFEKKGTIMGAILAANGVGGAIAIWTLAPIIEKSRNSYRNAYFLVFVILVLVGTLITVLFRDKPEQSRKQSHDADKHKSKTEAHSGIEFSKALKMPFFYIVILCIFFSGFVLQGITAIDKAHMTASGLDGDFATKILGVSSLTLAICKFLTGVIYDKFGLRLTVSTCCMTGVTVLVLLLLVDSSFVGKIFAVIYAVFSSLALPLETIMLPIYARELFGERAFNQVLGVFVSVNTAGYALGAPLINLSYDVLGNYTVGLVVCSAIMILVTVGINIAISLASKVKRDLKTAEEGTELQSADA